MSAISSGLYCIVCTDIITAPDAVCEVFVWFTLWTRYFVKKKNRISTALRVVQKTRAVREWQIATQAVRRQVPALFSLGFNHPLLSRLRILSWHGLIESSCLQTLQSHPCDTSPGSQLILRSSCFFPPHLWRFLHLIRHIPNYRLSICRVNCGGIRCRVSRIKQIKRFDSKKKNGTSIKIHIGSEKTVWCLYKYCFLEMPPCWYLSALLVTRWIIYKTVKIDK